MPFLQEAVKRFELMNPADGEPFPNLLPRESLPTIPDPEISEWHSAVSEKLMLEAQASAARNMPPRPQMALSDIDLESSRDSSVDSHSVAGTDMAGYFAGVRSSLRPPSYSGSRAPPHPPPQYPNEAPWSPERRRSGLPDNSRGSPATWPRDGPAPSTFPPPPRDTPNTHSKHHGRADSDLSTISTSASDSSSMTTSSASLSPVRYHSQLHPSTSPSAGDHSITYPLQRPASYPQGYLSPQQDSSGIPSRTKNVRWQDMGNIHERPKHNPRRDGRTGRDLRHGYSHGRLDERARGRLTRSTGPNTGVGGRRYVEGWNQR